MNIKLYANQKNIRLFYYVIPIGLVLSICIPMYKGVELTTILLSNLALYIIFGITGYAAYRQSSVPIFEMNDESLVVNDVLRVNKTIPLGTITGVKKSIISGYKLLTLSGDIFIPLGLLREKDRELFLSALNLEM